MTDVESSQLRERGPLRLDLRIETDEGFDCPLVTSQQAEEADEFAINAVDGDCVVDMVSATDDAVTRGLGAVTDGCFCRVLNDFHCAPHVLGVEGNTVLLRAYVSDRQEIRDLVAALRADVGTVALEKLTTLSSADRTECVTIDLSRLTSKQREALELALLRGYFGGETDLEELATQLDISKSALSQRLRAGQAKLVQMSLGDQ